MGADQFFLFRWVLRAARWCFWLYRKMGLPDFHTAMLLFGITVLSSTLSLALFGGTYFGLLKVSPFQDLTISLFVSIFALIASLFGISYVFRIRKVGIISADAAVETGLDYASALEKVSKGFDFLGIGASKLTAQSKAFTEAVERVCQKRSPVRILLCDPRSPAIERLETHARADTGRYKANVKQSFTFLEHLRGRFPESLQIRLYKAENEKDLPSFRLMFINQTLCLVSQTVLGAPKQGRLLPQVHFHREPAMGLEPTFYEAYSSFFEQLWNISIPITVADFQSISQIDVTGTGRNK